jgi:hypothetical protein
LVVESPTPFFYVILDGSLVYAVSLEKSQTAFSSYEEIFASGVYFSFSFKFGFSFPILVVDDRSFLVLE